MLIKPQKTVAEKDPYLPLIYTPPSLKGIWQPPRFA
jgi:hypothetical protein